MSGNTKFNRHGLWLLAILMTLFFSSSAMASTGEAHILELTHHWAGFLCLAIFLVVLSLVIAEEQLHLRKSKPVIVGAGIIWTLVAIVYAQHGDTHTAEQLVRHNLLEVAELFFFLLAAMTYINAMDERGIFGALRAWLVSQSFSFRSIFWITGLLSFFISPIADNLTTAILMSTVIIKVGTNNPRFAAVACINVVVASNAGGAFSPFGDITTLMVWQKGIVKFQEFFVLFFPSLVSWLIPAVIMSFVVTREKPARLYEKAVIKDGGWVIVWMFLITVAMAVSTHSFLNLPPVLGMMTGLGFLKLYGHHLKTRDYFFPKPAKDDLSGSALEVEDRQSATATPKLESFDIFKSLERAEWDTLMFFYGIILCVGGISAFGYLAVASEFMYGDLGPTFANILVGILSSIVDNIPVMFSVLTVLPDMSLGQWLLVTLTAGVGGSILSIGSAAGVAVMGQARGIYTFLNHLKWSWVILLGYGAGIWVHFLLNADKF